MGAAAGRFDIAIVGGGIIGLATALALLERNPGISLCLIEKEPDLARHQSGHNTGVIHAGIYYRPGSLKARLCREGKEDLIRFAEEHSIPYKLSGKLIVALDEQELPRLAELKARAEANGVPGVEEIGAERIREIEPHAVGRRALWSKTTGVIDFRQVALAYAGEVRRRGGEIRTGTVLTGVGGASDAIREGNSEVTVRTSGGEITAKYLIACAGLHSDRVAAMTGDRGELAIVPFRGDYYTFAPGARHLVRSLINPVPDPAFPFLGVHFTRRLDGEVWAGPNAVLAFAREGYTFGTISPRDLFETFAFPGFRRLIRRYMKTGVREMIRDAIKPAYVRALQRYIPEIRSDQLVFGPSGVRAQSLDTAGNLLDDFVFSGRGRVLHVRNAPSPGATASLAIGKYLAGTAEERFGFTR